MNDFTICQTVASAISGWDPLDSGARSDYYYDDCHTDIEKLEHIIDYALNGLNLPLSATQYMRIFKYLETQFDDNNCKTHAFWNL